VKNRLPRNRDENSNTETRTPNSVSTTTTVRRHSNTILNCRLKSTITSFSVFRSSGVSVCVCVCVGVATFQFSCSRYLFPGVSQPAARHV
jgi:hypothetical protein